MPVDFTIVLCCMSEVASRLELCGVASVWVPKSVTVHKWKWKYGKFFFGLNELRTKFNLILNIILQFINFKILF